MKNSEQTISEYLSRIGCKGGKVRAEKHSKAQLSEWAKKGGRPPKKGNKTK